MNLTANIEQLVEFLKANHFASGGLVVGFTGVVLALLRTLPGRFIRFLWRQMSLEVVIKNETDLFDAVEFWLAHKGTSNRTRVFSAQYRFGAPDLNDNGDSFPEDSNDRKKKPGLELAPGVGNHWIWYKGKPVLLARIADQAKQSTSFYGKARESFTLYFIGRDSTTARGFLREAVSFCNPPDQKMVRVFTAGVEEWRVSSVSRVRPPKTVVLREGTLDRLTADVERFFERQNWYTELGIPYRRGYLFTGPPGNGKTTTVQVLAGIFQAPVCVLDLGNPLLSDDKLRNLMNTAPAGAFFLLEDIDALFRKRKASIEQKPEGEEQQQLSGVTFSGLLNALDGVMAPSGRLVFMSTNHPEKLDPALIRPGRVDFRMEFPNADQEQARQMFVRFFGGSFKVERLADEFAEAIGDGRKSMATVQGILLESADDPEKALDLTGSAEPDRSTICLKKLQLA